jgi:8-oxo-dGTP pyrophosphatase MutT (NUDIX family)
LNRTSTKAATPPSDAATLIIVRFDGPVPRILMGQRHPSHVFMPGKFVFPGGRLESGDGRRIVAREGDPITMQKLKMRMRGKPSHARARGLLLAAIRETFEETGLLVGHDDVNHPPDLSGLIYIARAITPPGRSRRFDSRFFVCDAQLVSNLNAPHPLEATELLTLKWVTLEDALELNLPSITKDILGLLEPFLAQKSLPPVDCPVSFQYNRGKAWIVDTLPAPRNLTFPVG